jgi:hypothetical protein
MRKAEWLNQGFAVLLVISLVFFLFFGQLADNAMDKSGIGDLAAFQHYSQIAGLFFWTAVGSWIASVIFAQLAPQPYRGRAIFCVGLLLPVAFVIGILLLLLR